MKVDASSVNQFTTTSVNSSANPSLTQPTEVAEQASDKVTISSEAAALFQQSLEKDDKGDGSATPMNGGGTEPPIPPKEKT